MMEKLAGREDELARKAQEREVQRVAPQLRTIFGSAAVDVQETRLLVRGPGMIKRWLIEPSLRFLGGGLK